MIMVQCRYSLNLSLSESCQHKGGGQSECLERVQCNCLPGSWGDEKAVMIMVQCNDRLGVSLSRSCQQRLRWSG